MPTSVSGIGVRITSGSLKLRNCADDQHIDAEQRDHEGRAHVAEGHPGDLPFAVPQQRGMAFILGLAVEADVGLLQALRLAQSKASIARSTASMP